MIQTKNFAMIKTGVIVGRAMAVSLPPGKLNFLFT
nr:MAG TPA: hypothetical protein [Caudoviricetes sp.]